MTDNMSKCPPVPFKPKNQAIGWLPRTLCFLDGGTGDRISADLEVIWEMSVYAISCR